MKYENSNGQLMLLGPFWVFGRPIYVPGWQLCFVQVKALSPLSTFILSLFLAPLTEKEIFFADQFSVRQLQFPAQWPSELQNCYCTYTRRDSIYVQGEYTQQYINGKAGGGFATPHEKQKPSFDYIHRVLMHVVLF